MRGALFSVFVGIALGFFYFVAIHPVLVGESDRLILERESVLAFAFRGLPILAAVISVYVGLFGSDSKRHAFFRAATIGIGCLLPLPLGQYILKAPRLFGLSRTSWPMLIDEAVALVVLLVAIAAIGGTATVVSPMVSRAVGRRKSSHP